MPLHAQSSSVRKNNFVSKPNLLIKAKYWLHIGTGQTVGLTLRSRRHNRRPTVVVRLHSEQCRTKITDKSCQIMQESHRKKHTSLKLAAARLTIVNSRRIWRAVPSRPNSIGYSVCNTPTTIFIEGFYRMKPNCWDIWCPAWLPAVLVSLGTVSGISPEVVKKHVLIGGQQLAALRLH